MAGSRKDSLSESDSEESKIIKVEISPTIVRKKSNDRPVPKDIGEAPAQSLSRKNSGTLLTYQSLFACAQNSLNEGSLYRACSDELRKHLASITGPK